MRDLLKEVKSVFFIEVEKLKFQIENFDKMTFLAEDDKDEALFFEIAEEARMQLEQRETLIRRIDKALANSLMMSANMPPSLVDRNGNKKS